MINILNTRHSIIFFTLSIILVSLDYFRNNLFLFTCLILILSIGISHGSLDNLKGAKLLKIYNLNNMLYFYIGYSAVCLIVIGIWFLSATFLLILFLIVASYHFGKEDSEFLFYTKNIILDILFFFKGTLIISSPLLFHHTETIIIFNTIGMDTGLPIFTNKFFIAFILCLSVLSSVFIVILSKSKSSSILILDLFAILILNYFIQPLLAFTIYFCFLHSIRHSISLMYQLNNDLTKSARIFLKKSLPLTIVTAILFIIAFSLLIGEYDLSSSVNKVIFVGLAALTFPHIILEYILEKNEK